MGRFGLFGLPTKKERYSVTAFKVDRLLPNPESNLGCFQFSKDWIQYIVGIMSPLRAKYAHLDEFQAENISRFTKFIDSLEHCDMISDLRIASGMLQAQYCGSSNWVNIGRVNQAGIRSVGGKLEYDFDGDGIFEVTQFINPTQNFYGGGLPLADADDQICRASWMLARAICDDYKDMIQIMRGVTNAVFGGIEWLTSLLPYTAFVESVETLHGLVGETAMDFLDANILDDETVRFVAETIFCALKEAYPTNLDDFWQYVDFGQYEPIITYDPVATLTKMVNHQFLIETVVNVATGKNTGYLALAYAKATSDVGLSAVGVVKPLEQILTYALNTALYFDSRDCGQFGCNEWTAIFDFEIASYTEYVKVVPGSAAYFPSYGNGLGYQTTDTTEGGITYRMFFFMIDAGQDYTITGVTANTLADGVGPNADFGISKSSPPNWGVDDGLITIVNGFGPGTQAQFFESSFEPKTVRYLRVICYIGADAERIGQGFLKKITVSGRGVNPFLGVPTAP